MRCCVVLTCSSTCFLRWVGADANGSAVEASTESRAIDQNTILHVVADNGWDEAGTAASTLLVVCVCIIKYIYIYVCVCVCVCVCTDAV